MSKMAFEKKPWLHKAWGHKRRLGLATPVLITLKLAVCITVLGALPAESLTTSHSINHNFLYYTWNYVSRAQSVPFVGMGDRSLRVDIFGNPRMAYGGDHLYFTQYDGTQWRTETVDNSPNVGASAALKMDGAGHPYISYADSQQQALKYAWNDGTNWHIVTVDRSGKVTATAITVDSAARPYIAYIVNDSILKYARFDGRSWHIETVQANGWGLLHPSLVLDMTGSPNLVYVSRYAIERDPGLGWDYYSQVIHARRTATSWQTSVLGDYFTGDPSDLGASSLALDSAGLLHVSFYGFLLMYGRYDGIHWQIETASNDYGNHPSLALDSLGQPHISYNTNGGVKHTWREGTKWGVETIGPSDVDAPTSLAISKPSGYLHLSYYSGHYLKHVWFNGSRWQSEFIDTDLRGSLGGPQHSLALDRSNQPHLAYYLPVVFPDAEARLEYASSVGTENGSFQWASETIDSGYIGMYPSLTLDASDRPHVTYCDYSKPVGGVKYAQRDGTHWRIELIDSWQTTVQAPCKFTTLVLDNLGHPHISYVNGASGVLKYAWHDGNTWHSEIVTNINVVDTHGPPAVLALDGAGNPHLVFDNGGVIRHAWRTGAYWQFETLEWNASPGRGVALAIDAFDRLHVSYVVGINLMYAQHDGTGWHSEVIDCCGDIFHFPVLRVDSAGQPYAAYCVDGVWWVRVSKRDETGWHEEVTYSGKDVTSVSLVLDQFDLAHFSYFSWFYLGLTYVYPVWPDPASLKLEVEPHAGVQNGDALTYTASIYGPYLDLQSWVFLPAQIEYVENSVTPPAVYSPTLRAIVWQGQTDVITPQVIQFQGVVSTTDTGTIPVLPFANVAQLTDDFDRTVYSVVIINPYRFYLPVLVR